MCNRLINSKKKISNRTIQQLSILEVHGRQFEVPKIGKYDSKIWKGVYTTAEKLSMHDI